MKSSSPCGIQACHLFEKSAWARGNSAALRIWSDLPLGQRMNHGKILRAGILVTFALCGSASGYEIETHAIITSKAYDASVLNPADPKSIVSTLGFDRLNQDYPFAYAGGTTGTSYRDEAAVANPADFSPVYGANYDRLPQIQERNVLGDLVDRGFIAGPSVAAAEQRVRSWLIRGAVREDDNDGFVPIPGVGWSTLDQRDPDPFGPTPRATRHFYDPVHDRAYFYPDTCAQYTCVRSVMWAMGRTDPLHPASDADDTSRRNHFTWQDARNNLWWALTLKRDTTADGKFDYTDAIYDGIERMLRHATAVKSIGHVIHLLEDTAQPQHVRNDAHAPPNVVVISDPSEGEADSAFEAYTNYRLLRDYSRATEINLRLGNPLRRMVNDDLPTPNNLPLLRFGDGNVYPGGGARVQFSTPGKFFSTNAVESGGDLASLRSRRGLSDMSNRSFFTSGTLPGFRECQSPGSPTCVPTANITYPLPLSDLTDPSYVKMDLSTTLGLRVGNRIVYTTVYTQQITDAVAANYDAGVLAPFAGRAPLLTQGIWHDLIPNSLAS